jgi:hypothetical protein
MCCAALLVGTVLSSSNARSEACRLSADHAGVMFPVEKLVPDQTCRLQLLIDNFTTANKVGPFRTPLPEGAFAALLDHPPLAAVLVNRLGFASYQVLQRGEHQFHGKDGEGLEGLFEPVYRDRTSRIYYLEGRFVRKWLPSIAGKAVVFVRLNPVKESDGSESIDITLVCYTRLNSRVLSGLVSLFRPLIGSGVVQRLTRAVEAATRLSHEMRKSPERVLEKAAVPPPLTTDDLALLKRVLAELHEPSAQQLKGGSAP